LFIAPLKISPSFIFLSNCGIRTDYDRIIKNIERGEARISRKDEIMKAIGKKLDRYKNPWLELKIQYGQNKGKLYNEECDRFMVHFF
jgi:SWI/SNF-related matrix-associated actin-dependent regulator of chromatin subfamily A member 5